MLNGEKYKDELENLENRSLVCFIAKEKVGLRCDVGYCLKCEKEAFKWLLEEYKEPILTDKEKEILKNISRRFDNIGHHIITIKKKKCFVDNGSLIFKVKVDAVHHTYSESDLFYLDKKFKGMELEKEYTLEELGL